MCGSQSHIHRPLWPCCDHLRLLASSGAPYSPIAVMTGRSCPAAACRASSLELGLGVEQVDVARAAFHEQEDDALGPGGVMRRGRQAGQIGAARACRRAGRARRRRPGCRAERLPREQVRHRQRRTRRPPGEEVAAGRRRLVVRHAGDGGLVVRRVRHVIVPSGQSTYRNSLEFSSTWHRSIRAGVHGARSSSRRRSPAAGSRTRSGSRPAASFSGPGVSSNRQWPTTASPGVAVVKQSCSGVDGAAGDAHARRSARPTRPAARPASCRPPITSGGAGRARAVTL